MNKSGPNGFVAVVFTIAILAAVVLALAASGVPITCDPPRHEVVVPTLDGFGHHECVPATSPPGTPPAGTTRR